MTFVFNVCTDLFVGILIQQLFKVEFTFPFNKSWNNICQNNRRNIWTLFHENCLRIFDEYIFSLFISADKSKFSKWKQEATTSCQKIKILAFIIIVFFQCLVSFLLNTPTSYSSRLQLFERAGLHNSAESKPALCIELQRSFG